MATRKPQSSGDDGNLVNQTTDFQLYSNFTGTLDFTYYKLLSLIKRCTNPVTTEKLVTVYEDYRAGRVAVAWRRGEPTFIRIVKG
jgi:hypothetical protein